MHTTITPLICKGIIKLPHAFYLLPPSIFQYEVNQKERSICLKIDKWIGKRGYILWLLFVLLVFGLFSIGTCVYVSIYYFYFCDDAKPNNNNALKLPHRKPNGFQVVLYIFTGGLMTAQILVCGLLGKNPEVVEQVNGLFRFEKKGTFYYV